MQARKYLISPTPPLSDAMLMGIS